MLLSLDMFKYLNFDYKFFKPSKILIFEWSVNFTDQQWQNHVIVIVIWVTEIWSVKFTDQSNINIFDGLKYL